MRVSLVEACIISNPSLFRKAAARARYAYILTQNMWDRCVHFDHTLCFIFSVSVCSVTGGELFEDIVAREYYSEADARYSMSSC